MAEVEFAGQSFTTTDRLGLMPLMRFAKVAKAGLDTSDMGALSAVYDLLRDCIDPACWARFEEAADSSKAGAEELLEVITNVIQVLAARPTSLPSDSSAGQPTTAPTSTPVSSSPALDRLASRPDLQLVIQQAQQAQTA